MLIFISLILLLAYNIYRIRRYKDNVITYNETEEVVIIENFNKKIKIKREDIKRITYHNIGISKDSFYIIARQSYGKLKFYLSSGKVIKSDMIMDIYSSYDRMNECIFQDYEIEETEYWYYKVEGKVSNWGKRREYPAILSVIISILLPLIGIVFVFNQAKLKEFIYGKNNGLVLLSIVISLFWWGIAGILIYIL